MNFRIGICDDQEFYVKKIEQRIQAYFEESKNKCKITTYQSGEALLKDVSDLDILFLDIEMGDINGIDIKNKISDKKNNCQIVFVSNYEQRMKEAFGVNVKAFITKDQLNEINKVLEEIEREHEMHNIIKIAGEVFDTYEIIYVEADGAYCNIYTKDACNTVSIYLKQIKLQLNQNYFIQIHRSYIINMKYIKDIPTNSVMLANNKIISISRTFRKDFSLKYFEYVRRNER